MAAFSAIVSRFGQKVVCSWLSVLVASTRRSVWLVLVPATVLALGLGGLPLTGGALAKLAMKPVHRATEIVGVLATLSAIGSTLLMLHFLRRMWSGSQRPEIAEGSALVWPWLATALAAAVLPWMLYSSVTNDSLRSALAPAEIWEALWPVLLGALARAWRSGVGDRVLPRMPGGGFALQLTRGLCVSGQCLGCGDGKD